MSWRNTQKPDLTPIAAAVLAIAVFTLGGCYERVVRTEGTVRDVDVYEPNLDENERTWIDDAEDAVFGER